MALTFPLCSEATSMTDTTDSTPPFPGFPGFPPAEMLERMWGMMRLSPFGSAFPVRSLVAALGPRCR